ncbi:MAG: B12-binding domain-containing radical SAM protein [Patescibacteria group bacterium]|jgi:anaerobic magnesium-protoporphyrin IX monomethyl ester cyclase
MKVVIGYPPMKSPKGVPRLSQNRQFQWFPSATYIYPVVPAQAATLLKEHGHEILWLDGIAEKKTYKTWLKEVVEFGPDLIVMETKTPVIKRHWQIINEIKTTLKTKVILVGDHVTALPEESFSNSKVDFILCGGDYDFLLLSLANHLAKGTALEPGIWYRDKKSVRSTGRFALNHDLNTVPFIDRELTRWQLYAHENGNFKYTPGTYIMSGRDCWWRKTGGCSFCSWTTLYPKFRVRSAENVLDEIGELIKKYNVKEIMDDAGTMMVGKWLRLFCKGMVKRGYHKKVRLSCNMRFGALTQEDYRYMAKANFRFLLYGLESANQETLDRIGKGIRVTDVEKELEIIKKVNRETNGNLQPHVTCMVGYPWESEAEAKNTITKTKRLFERGLIDSLQVTLVVPYPGTRLFKECQKEGLLKTEDWDRYDMKEEVMKSAISSEKLLQLRQEIYKSFLTPRFIFSKVTSVRSKDDLVFLCKAGLRALGYMFKA